MDNSKQEFRSDNNGSFQTVDRELRSFELGGNRHESKSYTATEDATLAQGLILAYDTANDIFVDFDPDGEGDVAIPFGMLSFSQDVVSGSTSTLTVCVAGDVDESIAIAANSEANVNKLRGAHFGVRFVAVRELKQFDN